MDAEVRKDFNGKDYAPEELGEGSYWEMFDPYSGLFIYGKGLDSDYEEDMPIIEASRVRGYIFGMWYSVACPTGEMGSNHITRCRPISKETFEEAVRNGGFIEQGDRYPEGV